MNEMDENCTENVRSRQIAQNSVWQLSSIYAEANEITRIANKTTKIKEIRGGHRMAIRAKHQTILFWTLEAMMCQLIR